VDSALPLVGPAVCLERPSQGSAATWFRTKRPLHRGLVLACRAVTDSDDVMSAAAAAIGRPLAGLNDSQIKLIVSTTPRHVGNGRVIPYILRSRPKLCWQQDWLSIQPGQVGVESELGRDLD
jgi:hypothetical protein